MASTHHFHNSTNSSAKYARRTNSDWIGRSRRWKRLHAISNVSRSGFYRFSHLSFSHKFQGKAVEIDIDQIEDKPWRKPGAILSGPIYLEDFVFAELFQIISITTLMKILGELIL